MGALFRSEEMQLAQMYLQQEAAFSCVIELGELGLVEFRDVSVIADLLDCGFANLRFPRVLNPGVNAFQKKFVSEVRRCDEMERKLRFFEKEIKKDGLPLFAPNDNPEAPQPKEMVELEMTFEKLEKEVKIVNKNAEELKRTYLNLTELRSMLKKTQQFFDEVENIKQINESGLEDESIQLLGEEGVKLGGQHSLRLEFVSGVILRDRLPAFERMLWRVCRGNVFLRQAEIEERLEDPVTRDQVHKSVFIIFFQGEQLKSRVKKVCEGFHATLYPCPEWQNERKEMIGGVIVRIEDLKTIIYQTNEHRRLILIAAAKNLQSWFVKVRKLKSIYLCLNQFNFDVTSKCLIAECWYPTQDKNRINMALKRGTDRSGASVSSILNTMHTKQEPPTFHRTNKFTAGFQAIVDAYGVAKYREVNPAPFSIISFPFLFAVMFGDAGHGFIMFLAALMLVLKESQIKSAKSQNEIFNMFFSGRYLILLMGMFSVYTGMLYNDVFAKSANLFGTSWNVTEQVSHVNLTKIPEVQLNPEYDYSGTPYLFGLDPMWQVSKNKILFLNSYKMKLSVILGVLQMLFGIFLGFWNHTYFKNSINIFCQFIPEIIFILSIFGYMNSLIIFKWLTYSADRSGCAPSILITLINMFLGKYPDEKEENCQFFMFYPGQKLIQIWLIVLAVICIPWMLAIKPYLLLQQHRKSQLYEANRGRVNYSAQNNTTDGLTVNSDQVSVTVEANGMVGDGHEEGEKEEFDFGELAIHQAIHTIEYCLGSVSHTASYLRLWALSLAHAQLSEVLWNMVLTKGFMPDTPYFGGISLFLVFAFWATATVVVLILMEGLSAFLHALRLHWVEFNSKFYAGTGHIFQPFSFKNMLEAAESAE